MQRTEDSSYLEHISLNDKSIYFNRMKDMPANYYHWHQCVEILSVSQGVGIALMEHQQYTVKPGRIFIFPPGKLHKVFVEQDDRNIYHRTTLHFNGPQIEQYLRDFPRQQMLLRQLCGRGEKARVFDVGDVQPVIETLLSRFEEQSKDQTFSISDSAFLVMQLISLLPHQAQATGQNTFSVSIIRWIETHFHQRCSLEDIASEMGCSRGHASRRFHEETGGTIQEYLMMRRIRQACELLLHTNGSVRDIAAQVGFSEYAWFITCFRKNMGKTPLQYRKTYASV
ncbi:AraC family transcriptional regulator [Citrobacter werkmanii]|uniref:Arabinose operon regulatory protein n=1 Tax=Citrobacter werkmanii TaxID=67827 RepID=A0AA37ZAB4_9ENTR|nr:MULTISPECIES: AraC family transcriptional regulator [Citrobacter]GAS74648.1 HTH-type transcriptional activator RhaS [Salmonella enterica]EGT0638788.1 AraC family transcriptional regulator [Citrobacter werkmanii]EGT0671519.1 AraC family transcriptional regulator [Citrobacter werkmanii]MDN8556797.1 AraC family transcriptional regulator [Citrobacter werkmanii]MDV7070074.1 AraC family transcriptional regulator [Citrobacter werkmanii]